ncbi:MAG: M20 family metallopeptidase [Actinomycetota bacterium]|nr:M20 family metallopeptidase [Actinomycetota bacterium]
MPEVDHEGVVEFTRELVRIPSVNRPEDGLSEQPAAEAVAARMRSFGWDPVLEEVAPGRPNVLCTVDGGLPGPTLMFEGHTDVVTEGDHGAWTHPPFGAELVDGRIYGRGSADMKGGLAAMVYAADALRRSGPFPGRVLLAALCDEEEMMLGAKHFVARGHHHGVDGVIVCEPEEGEVCAVSKGAIRIRVDATGVMAHGAMPDHGRNPVTALGRLSVRLEQLQADLQARTGVHPHLDRCWITPTVLRGGDLVQVNVIPATATLAVDIRTTPDADHPALRAEIDEVVAAVADDTGVRLAITVLDDRPPADTPVGAPVVRALADAHRDVTGAPAPFGGVPGTTDGTILWRDGGLDTVVYGPGGKWIAHQVDEFVEAAAVVEAAEVYVAAARRFLGAVPEGAAAAGA